MPSLLSCIKRPTNVNVAPNEDVFDDLLKLVDTVLEFTPGKGKYPPHRASNTIGSVNSRLLSDLESDFFDELCVERKAADHILTEIQELRLLIVPGRPGVGKTTILKRIQRDLPKHFVPCYLDIMAKALFFTDIALELDRASTAVIDAGVSRVMLKLLLQLLSQDPTVAPEFSKLKSEWATSKKTDNQESYADFAEQLSTLLRARNIWILPIIDNVDQLAIPLQRALLDSCLELANALSTTVIYSIRDVNLRRLNAINAGASFTNSIDLPLSRGEIFEAIRRRVQYLFGRPYVIDFLQSEFEKAEKHGGHPAIRGSIKELAGRLQRTLVHIADELAKNANLLEASNESMRLSLVYINQTFERIFHDRELIRAGTLMQFLSGNWLEEHFLESLRSGSRRHRTLYYEALVQPLGENGKRVGPFPNVWHESCAFGHGTLLCPLAYAVDYVQLRTDNNFATSVPSRDVLEHLRVLGVSPSDAQRVLELLVREVTDAHDLGLLWSDRPPDDPAALIFLNPSAKFFRERLVQTVEYHFWSLVCRDWPEEGHTELTRGRLCTRVGWVDIFDDASKASFVFEVLNRQLDQGLALEVGSRRSLYMFSAYLETHWPEHRHLATSAMYGMATHLERITAKELGDKFRKVADSLTRFIED